MPFNSYAFRKEDLKPRLMPQRKDPLVYSCICPACNARYGGASHTGWIEIMRCNTCPGLRGYDIDQKRYEAQKKRYKAAKDAGMTRDQAKVFAKKGVSCESNI